MGLAQGINFERRLFHGLFGTMAREGNLLGHIALGLILVREAARRGIRVPAELRTQLEHLVLSHHGTREHGSPVEPKTIEAFILAAVDELDARINQVRRAVQEDAGDGEFTGVEQAARTGVFQGVLRTWGLGVGAWDLGLRASGLGAWDLGLGTRDSQLCGAAVLRVPSAKVIVPCATTRPPTRARPVRTPMRLRAA